jgi:hypothetical protein
MSAEFPIDVWIIGDDSDVTFGWRLVPEEINPTLFSIADMPGIVIWALADETNRNRNRQSRRAFITPHGERLNVFEREEVNQIRRLESGLGEENGSGSACSSSAGTASSIGAGISRTGVITARGTSFAASSDPCPPHGLLLSSEWC